MTIRASRGGCLGEALIALSLVASGVVTWRQSLWTGILSFPATFYSWC